MGRGFLELSGLELGSLVGNIDSTLAGYYVNNVCPVGSASFSFRMHRSDRPELYLVASPRIGFWVTSRDLPRGPASPFAAALRRTFHRARFMRAVSYEGERMLRVDFSTAEGIVSLLGEFFGAGNILVLDKTGRILDCLNRIETDERTLKPGVHYSPPPRRGPPPSMLELQHISTILSSELPVERALGRGLSLPGRVVEEALRRSSVSKGTKASSLSQEEIRRLYETFKEIFLEAARGGRLYVYFQEGRPVEVSAVRLSLGEGLVEKCFEDPNSALDDIFTPLLAQEGLAEGGSEVAARLRRLESSFKFQQQEMASLNETSEKLRRLAEGLMDGRMGLDEVAAQLHALGDSYGVEEGSGLWVLSGRKFRPDSPFSVASELYSEAKRLKGDAMKLGDALKRLEAESQELVRVLQKRRDDAKARPMARPRRWFEKFRWFHTSEGLLAIGGRDAGTNSLLVRRHLAAEDLIFHAEIPGSPFFVLKGGGRAGPESLRQVASATVSYSRAWREGLASADAYYVKPEQVSSRAPSGEYVPRGSFMVLGQRNYLKGVTVSAAVGLCKVDGELTVVGGPIEALLSHCKVAVELVPGHLHPSEAAKKVKRELSSRLSGEALAYVEGLPLDEIVRLLPSGKMSLQRVLRGSELGPPPPEQADDPAYGENR